MHDRRIDGVAHTFGNQGALFLSAMVWWDHETESLWTQPTGTAILGDYAGVRLEGIPASIEPWKAWLSEHPDTLVLEDASRRNLARQPFSSTTRVEVAGVLLGDDSRAWLIDEVRKLGAVNDDFAGIPVLVYADGRTGAVHLYLRETDRRTLEFTSSDGELRDTTTGSLWNGGSGIAIEGPLAGHVLRQLPHSSAFDWAWLLHHPSTTFWPDR